MLEGGEAGEAALDARWRRCSGGGEGAPDTEHVLSRPETAIDVEELAAPYAPRRRGRPPRPTCAIAWKRPLQPPHAVVEEGHRDPCVPSMGSTGYEERRERVDRNGSDRRSWRSRLGVVDSRERVGEVKTLSAIYIEGR
jgi:hypothetical protein